jgi:superfamily II DNA/RNA helicase
LKFSELILQPSLKQNIEKLQYSECTPIQAATMPLILEGKDVSGLAQTGTGKTAAFLIPMMDRILRGKKGEAGGFADWKPHHFILILVPTRELAEQVLQNVTALGNSEESENLLKGCAIYGGMSYDKQKEMLHKGVEFIVATPGRLIDLFKENVIDLKQVRGVVFDEADRMFDMGFKEDMKFILQRIPRERQFLFFSATLNFDVLNTAYQFGAEPVEVDVSRDQAKAENVKDCIFHIGQDEKPVHLISLLKIHKPQQTIIFSNFKHSVERIAQFLTSNGFPAMGISSLLSQAQRNRVIEQFKAQNELNILVATDVAARGLDIKGVDMVVNFELPQDAENYVHRIGRTGRAGAMGQAFSFVSDKDVENLSRIEDYLHHKLDVQFLENTDLVTEYKPLNWDVSYYPQEENAHGSKPSYKGDGSSRGGHQKSSHSKGRHQQGSQRGHHADKRGSDKPHHEKQARQEGSSSSSHRKPTHAKNDERGSSQRHSSNRKASSSSTGHQKSNSSHVKVGANSTSSHSRGSQSHSKTSSSRPSHSYTRGKGSKKTVIQKISGFFKKMFASK